jgi:hypothetical protein
MKGGKGNTFSTSLNKSFFSFFIVRTSRVFSENRSIAIHSIEIHERKVGKCEQTSEYIRAIAHAILIDIHVVVERVTKWKMILLTRYKTMNENERIKENVQCDVQEHLFH